MVDMSTEAEATTRSRAGVGERLPRMRSTGSNPSSRADARDSHPRVGNFAAVVLIAGALACIVAVVRGAGAPLVGATSAAALATAAIAYADDSEIWLVLPIVFAIAALALAVRRRFESLPWLSVLDAIMGGTASGAVAVALGASDHVSLAVGGAVGALALSRWQPSTTIALLGGATLLLGGGQDAAPFAAPLCGAAAWRSRPGSVPARPSAGPCSPRSSPSRRRPWRCSRSGSSPAWATWRERSRWAPYSPA